MKDITSSVYNFEDLIQGNFLYVDKTEYIWQLIRPAKESYFLSRPRRFGKSLTLSTLKAVFEGKKELFKGLAIYDKPYDWKKYPVIHLDFANCNIRTADELVGYLMGLYDFNSLGGGIILGVEKPVIKAHGAANEKSIVSTAGMLLNMAQNKEIF